MTLPVITEGKLLLIGFEDWSPQWHVLPLALVVLAGLWALVKRREWWRHFVRLWCHLTLLLRLHFHTHSLAAVRREWRAIQYVLSFSRCEVGPIWWDRYYSVANIHFYSFCLQCTNIQKMILKTFVEMHKVKGFCIYFIHFSWTSRSETAEKQQRQERTRAFMTSDFHVFFYDGSSNKYDTVSKTVFTEFTGLCEKICFTWRSFYCISRPEDSLWDCGSIVSRLPNQTLLMNGFGNQRPRCIFMSPSTYGST